ncbi:MAG: DUF3843 family protein [Tannerellaceae bacterium]|nr:DUF3843 family protein [Tannerellaceae bacterium]
MKQNIIFPKDWIKHMPYKVGNSNDRYYAKVATQIYSILNQSGIANAFDLDTDDMQTVSCYLTAWFVDIASEVNMWKSFTSECRKLYGKPLPFYDIDEEYTDGDINIEDICFLLWHYLQQINYDKIINPENPGIAITASQIEYYLYEELDNAPFDNRIHDFLYPDTDTLDFFRYRDLLNWFHFNSYLNIFNIYDLEDRMEELINSDRDDSEKAIIAYAAELNLCFLAPNKMLALTSPEWLAKIIPQEHPLHPIYNGIKQRDYTTYLFKREDDNYVYVTNAETEEEFAITKESLDTGIIKDLTSGENIILMMLVFYNKEWWQCGLLSLSPKEEKPEGKVTSETEKKMVYDIFMSASKGKQFLYFASEKEFYAFMKEDLNYSIVEDPKMSEKIKEKLFVTATPEDGILILNHAIECIKDPDNPFYDKKVAEQMAINFFTVPNFYPFNIVCLLIDNNMLPDASLNSIQGKKHGREVLTENLDFFIRYYLGKRR